MPCKTGEDQLLLLTLHMLRQRKYESRFSAWVARYALRLVVHAQGQRPRGSWLCIPDQRAEVGRHRDVHFPNQWLSVSPQMCRRCSDGSAPRRDSTWSLQPVTRQYGKHPQAVTYHTKGVWVRHGTDHENNVAICSKPFKTEEHCLHERQPGNKAFLCGRKQVTPKKKKSKMTRPSGDGQRYCLSSFGKGTNTLFDFA